MGRMDTYDTTQAPRLRAALLERAQQLHDALGHESEDARDPELRDVGDFKDAAVHDALATVDGAQSRQAAFELERVRAALRRMADGSYGRCLDCGEAIDLRRLLAMPTAAYCIACQPLHDQR